MGRFRHGVRTTLQRKGRKPRRVAQANAVLGSETGLIANIVVGEASASETNKDQYVSYNPVLFSTYLSNE